MSYMNCDENDLLKVITAEELEFASTVRIPYAGGGDLWARKHSIDAKIVKGIESGLLLPIQHIHEKREAHNIISDCLDGVLNPADGKRYDSKQRYYATLKEKGCHITDGTPVKRLETNHDVSKELKQALQQHLR